MRWIALLPALCGCLFPLPPNPPPNPHLDVASDCAPACENMRAMSCPGHEGSPGPDLQPGTADDVTCESACRDIINAEATTTLALQCTAKSASCDAVDECLALAD